MRNLRDRLKRIQELKKTDDKKINNVQPDDVPQETPPAVHTQELVVSELINAGWESCGYKVYKRVMTLNSPVIYTRSLPLAIKILVPDLSGQELPEIEDFLFFDLETTGLSGGAGTVAFLAAFANIENAPPDKKHQSVKCNLSVKQYLLLDYPGESDFITNVINELTGSSKVIVSYNGKCFDSQIIKTRCLMNRFKPPEYKHVDLLHPARRLWKNIIHDCSQTSVEAGILNIKRINDLPGSLAPEIWFEFLKTGRTDRLKGICDHNKDDIYGLASIFQAMISIAQEPLDTEKYKFDAERLALYWRRYLKKYGNAFSDDIRINGNNLLRFASDKNYPRAVYVYGYDLMKDGKFAESLKYVNTGLKLFDMESIWHKKLLRRKERLIKLI